MIFSCLSSLVVLLSAMVTGKEPVSFPSFSPVFVVTPRTISPPKIGFELLKVQPEIVRDLTLACAPVISVGLLPSCPPRSATLMGPEVPQFPSNVVLVIEITASCTATRFRSIAYWKPPQFVKVQPSMVRFFALVRYMPCPPLTPALEFCTVQLVMVRFRPLTTFAL